MSQVEAAASLFGSSDSGSDFFSVAESESSEANSAAGTSNGDDFYSSSSQAASGLFASVEGASGEQSLFDASGETAQTGGNHVPSFSDDSAHGQQYYEESHAQYASYTTETYAAHGQPAGHVYDQGTWQDEGLNQQAGNDTYYPTYDTNLGDAYEHPASTDTYSAYNSPLGGSQQGSTAHSGFPTQSTSSTFVPYSNSYSNSQSPSNAYYASPSTKPSEDSAYDPYKPTSATTQTRSISYSAATPSRASFTQVPVNSSTPLVSNVYEPPAQSTQAGTYSPYAPSTTHAASVPPPKLPTQGMLTPLNAPATEPVKSIPPPRPAISNAYDPPMPITQRKKSRSAFAPAQSPMPPQHSPFAAPPNIYGVQQPPQNVLHAVPPPPPPQASRSPPSFAYSPHIPPSDQYPRTSSPMKVAPPRATPPPPLAAKHYGPGSPQKGYAPLPQPPLPTGRMSPMQGPGVPGQQARQSTINYTPGIQPSSSTAWNGSGNNLGYANDDISHGNDLHSPEVDNAYSHKAPPLPSQEPHLSSPPRHGSTFEATRGMTPPVGLPRTSSPLQHLAYQQDDGLTYETNYTGQGPNAGEEQTAYGEPYGHVLRSSFDEKSTSPSGRSVRSAESTNAGTNATSMGYADSGQNVVDLTESDTSSIYNASSSPSSRALPPLAPSSGIISEETGLSFDSYNGNKPLSRSSSPQTFIRPTADRYAPVSHPPPSAGQVDASPSRMRSMSNTSTFSQTSNYDPYAPTRSNTIHEGQVVPSMYSAPSAYLPPSQSFPVRSSMEKAHSPPPVTGPYAPSPSLSGTNDPLGRTNSRAPVVQFGFGGKILTCSYYSSSLVTEYGMNIASKKNTDITVRLLNKLLPESAMDISAVVFPGPLFGDSGTPVTTLAITSTSGAAKAKKTKVVLTYLDERVQELEQGLGYHGASSPERRRAEGKLVLVRLLHTMIENDGHISGSPAAVSAARKALLPHIISSTEGTDIGPMNISMKISSDRGSTTYPSFGTSLNSDQTFAEYVVRTSALDKIQSFLLRGEMRQAYHFALDEKMWAHAMVIAHGLDKDAFKEVAEEFIKTELGVKGVRVPGSALPVKTEGTVVNGRECLRLAYGLYAGQASTAVEQLLPSRLSNGPTMTTLTVQPPTPLKHMTPMTPGFPSIAVATGVPPEMLAKWQDYAAILLSGQAGTDSSAALTTLGDYLVSNDWVEAGHCCYLMSPQTSSFGGVGTPAARIILLGSLSPFKDTAFYRDSDCFTFSEIVEYALSLRAPVKGQEAFGGFPHLQAYRLVRAQQLAELGHMAIAKRYCDAILTCTHRASPYLTAAFLEQLTDFSSRLNGNIELDKSSSWMGNKISKPSLDSIGGWLGGTLSKFVAGEAEPSSPLSREGSIQEGATYTGAFKHYSSISSTNPSRGPSPAPSVSSGPVPPPAQWKHGGASAPNKALYNSQNPISRASSAIDHLRPGSRKNTPPPRVASANAMTTTFAQSRAFSRPGTLQENDAQAYDEETSSDSFASQGNGGWWSAAYGDSGGPTPTATSFVHNDEHSSADTNGFISPVDSYQSSTSSATTPISQHMEDDEFDDELGLGNSAHKAKKSVVSEQKESKEQEAKMEPAKKESEVPKKPELKTAASSSWLGRLWSRGSTPVGTPPGPVKANLGEQSSFYYDKDLKRWVNKKAGAEAPKAEAPPPPPSRAQTASPSRVASAFASSPSNATPPPPRPMSATEPGMAPPMKSLPRIRSNLVPDASIDSAPPTPGVMSGVAGAPPTGRSKSAAAKRGARNRYVDVFQEGKA